MCMRSEEEGCPTVGISSPCKHFGGYWVILSVLPRLDPSSAKWDLNQPTITSSWNDNEWQTSSWEIKSWIRGRESRIREEASLQNRSRYLFNN